MNETELFLALMERCPNVWERKEKEIRADERRKLLNWLDKSEKYSLSKIIRCWEDNRYDQYLKVDIDEILSDYEKELKEGVENDRFNKI